VSHGGRWGDKNKRKEISNIQIHDVAVRDHQRAYDRVRARLPPEISQDTQQKLQRAVVDLKDKIHTSSLLFFISYAEWNMRLLWKYGWGKGVIVPPAQQVIHTICTVGEKGVEYAAVKIGGVTKRIFETYLRELADYMQAEYQEKCNFYIDAADLCKEKVMLRFVCFVFDANDELFFCSFTFF
jgi:hypothetical protein